MHRPLRRRQALAGQQHLDPLRIFRTFSHIHQRATTSPAALETNIRMALDARMATRGRRLRWMRAELVEWDRGGQDLNIQKDRLTTPGFDSRHFRLPLVHADAA